MTDLVLGRSTGVNEAVAERIPPLAGSEVDSFAALYERTFPRVYAYVASLVRDRATAEDVTAQAFERAYRRRLSHGGFVLSSSVDTGKDGSGGDFSLRIPSERLRPALRDLAALAPVIRQAQEGRDVTREHVTAKDRLQAARAERRSLLDRLEAADTDAEADALRRQLDLVAGEINGLRGRLRDLRLRTDYAVVLLSLVAAAGSDGSGAGDTFDDAVGDAGDLLVATAGVLIRALAVALPLALIAGAGWAASAWLRRRRRESALV